MNPHSQHSAPLPTKAELLARLIVCAAVLHLRSEEAEGEYKAYFADRAAQCRSWAAGVRAGDRNDLENIAGGLAEFEAMAL